jgi:hypothetical protein
MSNERLAVILPLKVLTARRRGAHVMVGVADGRRRRHRIAFEFASVAHACVHIERVQAWMRAGTEMAYVRGKSESVLIDLEGLLARAV